MTRPASSVLKLILVGTVFVATLSACRRAPMPAPAPTPAAQTMCSAAPAPTPRRRMPWEEGCSDPAAAPALAQR